MSKHFYQSIQASLDSISLPLKPKTAMILGSGLDLVLSTATVLKTIPYDAISGFCSPTAPSHHGELHLVLFDKTPVLVFSGRFHLYEGLIAQDVVKPIYLSKLLGIEEIIITNATGSLNPDFAVGDIMLITDHINFTGHNPLIGFNDEWFGPRFPDMSQPYDQTLRQRWLQAASDCDIDLRQGIYIGVQGPSLETSAERRMMHLWGADAVGMSTVLEVIAANHCGLKVLGISSIANIATGADDQQADDIASVLAGVALAATKIRQVLPHYLNMSL